ncbi:disease resistance protein RPM1-like [Coffea arabica]|uniref:Disease resistance protein RPM1-like n=1 Tax=Coffea arabica TaxID=13443 RepID=A0A6P6VAT7_COFAR|nr:disease resistance protein RPM1-like [Coffea arabica]
MKELINRSLIQVESTWDDGTLDTCGLHDFVREILVSKSKEQGFMTVATKYYTRWPEKVRHLAIHNFTDNPQEFSSLKCLRSVVIFEYEDPLTTTFLSKFLHGDPKLLKVLDLDGAELDSIPKQVFKLFHLRYLSLNGTGVRIIPKSIGKLQNLEVLSLMETNVTELPMEILKLRKLRSLFLGGMGDYSNEYAIWGCKCPLGIGKLICLEELYGIEADSDKIVREVGKLTQLRRLAIRKLRREDGKELLSSLLRLTNLRVLSISCIKEDETLDLQHSVSPKLEFLTILLLKGRLERVPQWVTSLQSLRTLRLVNSRLREDENVTGSLGHLPNLVSLTLYGAYEGETICFKKIGGFQKLQSLELVQLTRLKWVRVEEESMPNLRNLRLGGCKLMQELPSGIQNLTRLEYLGFYEMSDELMHKVQNLDKQSEDYQTISHIPQVFTGHWIDGQWKGTFL